MSAGPVVAGAGLWMSRQDFERIYERHFEAVFRYVGRSVARRDIAEEITADAFVRLLRHGDRVNEDRLPAWLIAVARNLIVDHWRVIARETPLDSGPEPQAMAGAGVDWASLLMANADLKPAHRACLLLRYVHGMDREEIAQHTGLTDNQVKSSLQYGLQLLRRVLVRG